MTIKVLATVIVPLNWPQKWVKMAHFILYLFYYNLKKLVRHQNPLNCTLNDYGIPIVSQKAVKKKKVTPKLGNSHMILLPAWPWTIPMSQSESHLLLHNNSNYVIRVLWGWNDLNFVKQDTLWTICERGSRVMQESQNKQKRQTQMFRT